MSGITDPQSQSSYSDLANPNIHSVAEGSLGDTTYNQRILPRQLSTGSLRGTQTVGYGGVKIDGSNNRITLGSKTDSLGQKQEAVVGKLSVSATGDQSFGLRVYDASGAYISIGILPDGYLGMQLVDKNGNEVQRVGYLPVSGVYGWATATPNNSLEGQV